MQILATIFCMGSHGDLQRLAVLPWPSSCLWGAVLLALEVLESAGAHCRLPIRRDFVTSITLGVLFVRYTPLCHVLPNPSSTVRFTKILSIHGNLSRRGALALHFWGKR